MIYFETLTRDTSDLKSKEGTPEENLILLH